MVCWLLGHRLNIKLRLHLTIDSEKPAEKKEDRGEESGCLRKLRAMEKTSDQTHPPLACTPLLFETEIHPLKSELQKPEK